MPTVVTLDPDVEQLLQTRMQEEHRSLDEVLNGVVRRALEEAARKSHWGGERDLKMHPGIDATRLSEIAAKLVNEKVQEVHDSTVSEVVVETFDLGGLQPGVDSTKLSQLAEELEMEEFAAKMRRSGA